MEQKSNLPILAKPAHRVLANAGITSLKQLTKFTEAEIAALHGIGKNAIESIKQAFVENGLSFKK